MIQEETRIRLQVGVGGLPGVKSALAVFNSGNSKSRDETRKCYNCGEIGHLKSVCTKPPKVKNSGGCGQSRDRSRGHSSRGSERGGYRTHLMVVEQEKEVGERDEDLSVENQKLLKSYSQLLRRRQGGVVGDASISGNLLLMPIQPQVLVTLMPLPLYPPLDHHGSLILVLLDM